MKIVVLVKAVPDLASACIDEETGLVMRRGMFSCMNPLDAHALALATRLKATIPSTRITALSMGTPAARKVLREALAMGADDALLASNPAFAGSDTLATSAVLAACLKKTGFDMVVCGRQAVDGETAQVPPQVAARLGVPFVPCVHRLEGASTRSLRAACRTEGGVYRMEIPLPAVISVQKDIATPQATSLEGWRDAIEQPVRRWGPNEIGIDRFAAGLEGSPTRVVEVFQPRRARRAEQLPSLPSKAAEELTRILREKGIP